MKMEDDDWKSLRDDWLYDCTEEEHRERLKIYKERTDGWREPSMTELKPCPFCGSEARQSCETFERTTLHWVYCASCGSAGGYRHTEAEAIAAWNTRAAIEFDNWFYLPKPNEPIVEVTETTHAWDGTKVKTDVYYQIQEQAIVAWARELDEHITKRICEVWNPERTCHSEYSDRWECSECGFLDAYVTADFINYCPNCGAKVVEK